MLEEKPQRISIEQLERRVKALEDRANGSPLQQESEINPLISYAANATANTEDPISHTLKRVPKGYTIVSQDIAGNIYSNYSGMTTWTAEKIYVKCSAASMNAKLLLF